MATSDTRISTDATAQAAEIQKIILKQVGFLPSSGYYTSFIRMNSIQTLLGWAKQRVAALDAEVLLAHTLAKPRSYLFSHSESSVSETESATFSNYINRRLAGEPVAYITGRKEFWSLELAVNSATLIPRPETELIVEQALKLLGEDEALKIADLGTGSGAIALAIATEKPRWEIVATDISENALAIAAKNAQHFGIENVAFYQGNWCTALPFAGFDAIVSNPPYIAKSEWLDYAAGLKFEPKSALLAGEDGLDAIKNICKSVKNYLKPKGYAIVEHGFLQGKAVRDLFAAAGLTTIVTVQDLSGQERVTIGQRGLT